MKKTPPYLVVALIVAGLLVLAVGGYFLLISPQRARAAKLEQEIVQVERQLASQRRLLEAARYNQPIQVADLFRLTKAIPDSLDMPGILLELNHVAESAGIEFQSITPQTAVTQPSHSVVPINLTFQGNFYELSDFLFRLRNLVSVRGGQLEATGRLFVVRSLSFSEGENGFPEVGATLIVDAFIHGAAATSTTPATPATEATAAGADAQGQKPATPPASGESAAGAGS